MLGLLLTMGKVSRLLLTFDLGNVEVQVVIVFVLVLIWLVGYSDGFKDDHGSCSRGYQLSFRFHSIISLVVLGNYLPLFSFLNRSSTDDLCPHQVGEQTFSPYKF